jgi:hypothetical protein
MAKYLHLNSHIGKPQVNPKQNPKILKGDQVIVNEIIRECSSHQHSSQVLDCELTVGKSRSSEGELQYSNQE